MSRLLLKECYQLWNNIVDKSYNTPVFAYTGGLIGGITGININNGKNKYVSGYQGALTGIVVGYLGTPALLSTLPITLPICLIAYKLS